MLRPAAARGSHRTRAAPVAWAASTRVNCAVADQGWGPAFPPPDLLPSPRPALMSSASPFVNAAGADETPAAASPYIAWPTPRRSVVHCATKDLLPAPSSPI